MIRKIAACVVGACLLAAPGPALAQVRTQVDPVEGLTFSDAEGAYSLTMGFYTQTRLQWLHQDIYRRADPTLSTPPIPVENVGGPQESFATRRARFFLKGNFVKPWVKYKIELDLAGNDEGLRSVFIPANDPLLGFNGVNVVAGNESRDERSVKTMDLYVDLSPRPYAQFRIGQFKIPFGRQEIVSDFLLQMTARSIASDFFAPSRDRGILFRGGTETGKIQYQAGAFNGTGLAQGENLDNKLAYAFRLTATSGGPYLDVESTLDCPDSFKVQGGVNWYSSTDTPLRSSPGTPMGNVRDTRAAADLEFLWPRADILLEYFTRRNDVDFAFDLPSSCFGAFRQGRLSCDQYGLNAQAGYLIGDRHEVSARYSKIDNDKEENRDVRTEATLNYTLFIKGHNLRWSTSFSAFRLGVNAVGSSGFNVQLGKPPFNSGDQFFIDDDPNAFPGLKDDHDFMVVTQLQWGFKP
jgi:hypothetical protein